MKAIGTKRSMVSASVALLGLAAAASAQLQTAQPLSVVTTEDPAAPGAFTLSFGGLGLTTSSHITSTTYELRLDPFQGTAHFESYLQHVQPLILPGGFSTGDITVEIVPGSSAGTFDAQSRIFTTSEFYAVSFTGDLSAFGLTSPVFLPSSSTGLVALDPEAGGMVGMDWTGAGELANPFDPANPLTFTYACAVNTVFPADAPNVVGLALVPDVLGLALPRDVERSLVGLLDQALARIQDGQRARAVQSLLAFAGKVGVLSGRLIDPSEAAQLVTLATQAIDLLGSGRLSDLAPRKGQ